MSADVQRSRSFLREAAVLTVANFAIKIIGVLYKIPLTNILGNSIGIFNAAYSIYAMLFMLSTSGLPVAVSRMVAASNELGRGHEVKRLSFLATAIFGVVGFVFALLLIIFAPAVAAGTGHAESAAAMRAIAPSLFFVCVCASVRGYFQGLRDMYPTAISQFIEAFFKLTVGLGACMYAAKQGASAAVQAACAISGVSVGTFFGMVFILVCRRVSKKTVPNMTDKRCRSDKKLVRAMLLVALPVTLTAAALYFSQFLDTLIIVNALTGYGESTETAQRLYSAYTGLSVPIYDLLPSTLVFPIATSILPAVSGALAANDRRRAKRHTVQAIRLSGIIAIPCGVLLFVAGRRCITLLYGASRWLEPVAMKNGGEAIPLDAASVSLSLLGFAVFFISIVSTCNSLLNARKRAHLPFIAVLAGVAVLVIAEASLLHTPVGIYAAPISSVACYAVCMVLDIYFLRRCCGVKLHFLTMFRRPLLCGGVSAAATFIVYRIAVAISGNAVGRVASFFILLVTGVTLVISYCGTILLFRGIRESEVRLLPKGNFIADKLIKRGWLAPERSKQA